MRDEYHFRLTGRTAPEFRLEGTVLAESREQAVERISQEQDKFIVPTDYEITSVVALGFGLFN